MSTRESVFRRLFYSCEEFLLRSANRLIQPDLSVRDFTIITNNCWGGRVYQDLSLPYQTPLVGLFIYADCFITLLGDVRRILESPLQFTETSKYQFANEWRQSHSRFYPIGILDDGVEIHFLHYSSAEECETKWYRRLARVNWDRLYYKFNDQNLCTEEHLRLFDAMPLEPKVAFVAGRHTDLSSCVWMKMFVSKGFAANDVDYYSRYFDVITWLNEGLISDNRVITILRRMLEGQSSIIQTSRKLLSIVLGRAYMMLVLLRETGSK